jgi:hypothetical protein
MGGSSPVVDPQGNVYVASADGYDLGAGQPYDDSDAVLELSPTMHLESIFYPKDWQTLSADDLDLGTGDPVLVDGFVFQVGKTDIAYLLRQGHLGGEEGEVASLSMCSGNPDGGRAVEGSVVYVPCPNGVTAIKVSTKAPYLKQLWTDNDGAAGGPIIADGLVWTIGATTRCTASTRPTAKRSSRSPSAGTRTTSRRRRSAMACCSFLAPTRSSLSWVRPGCRRRPPMGETCPLAVGQVLPPTSESPMLGIAAGETNRRARCEPWLGGRGRRMAFRASRCEHWLQCHIGRRDRRSQT